MISKKKKERNKIQKIKKEKMELNQKRNTYAFKNFRAREVETAYYIWGFGHPVAHAQDLEGEKESNCVCQYRVVDFFV